MSFRYCIECRGDDPPFLTCKTCSKKYHAECVGISSKNVPDDMLFICSFCEQYSNHIPYKQPEELVQKLEIIKLIHNFQLSNRNEFIRYYFYYYNNNNYYYYYNYYYYLLFIIYYYLLFIIIIIINYYYYYYYYYHHYYYHLHYYYYYYYHHHYYHYYIKVNIK